MSPAEAMKERYIMQNCRDMEGWYAAEAEFLRKELACQNFDAIQQPADAVQPRTGLLSGLGQQAFRECHSGVSDKLSEG